jgi:hypothetical protein
MTANNDCDTSLTRIVVRHWDRFNEQHRLSDIRAHPRHPRLNLFSWSLVLLWCLVIGDFLSPSLSNSALEHQCTELTFRVNQARG